MLHEAKDDLFELMIIEKDNRKVLNLYVKLLEALEYDMQRVWGFRQDINCHTWWYRVPNCNCPKMDNADPLMPGRIIREDCPVHGKER